MARERVCVCDGGTTNAAAATRPFGEREEGEEEEETRREDERSEMRLKKLYGHIKIHMIRLIIEFSLKAAKCIEIRYGTTTRRKGRYSQKIKVLCGKMTGTARQRGVIISCINISIDGMLSGICYYIVHLTVTSKFSCATG